MCTWSTRKIWRKRWREEKEWKRDWKILVFFRSRVKDSRPSWRSLLVSRELHFYTYHLSFNYHHLSDREPWVTRSFSKPVGSWKLPSLDLPLLFSSFLSHLLRVFYSFFHAWVSETCTFRLYTWGMCNIVDPPDKVSRHEIDERIGQNSALFSSSRKILPFFFNTSKPQIRDEEALKLFSRLNDGIIFIRSVGFRLPKFAFVFEKSTVFSFSFHFDYNFLFSRSFNQRRSANCPFIESSSFVIVQKKSRIDIFYWFLIVFFSDNVFSEDMDIESLYDYVDEEQDFYDESPGSRKGYPIDHRALKVSCVFFVFFLTFVFVFNFRWPRPLIENSGPLCCLWIRKHSYKDTISINRMNLNHVYSHFHDD